MSVEHQELFSEGSMFARAKADARGRRGRDSIVLRRPRAADLPALEALSAAVPTDSDARYGNLLHCTHFAGTSVAAEQEGRLVGFVAAYRPPERPETLFLWLVAVDAALRGRGLGRAMVRHLLARPACAGVRYVETSIADDNGVSEVMLTRLASQLGTGLKRYRWFERGRSFNGAIVDGAPFSETLLRIGPFDRELTSISARCA